MAVLLLHQCLVKGTGRVREVASHIPHLVYIAFEV